jgi:hypothetical protein
MHGEYKVKLILKLILRKVDCDDENSLSIVQWQILILVVLKFLALLLEQMTPMVNALCICTVHMNFTSFNRWPVMSMCPYRQFFKQHLHKVNVCIMD